MNDHVAEFIRDIYRQQEDPTQFRKTMDYIAETINDWLCDGRFDDVDSVLRRIQIYYLTTQNILTLLSMSLAAREKLRERHAFYDRCWDALGVMEGAERRHSLLIGLA